MLALLELKVDLDRLGPARASTARVIEELVRWAAANGRTGELIAAVKAVRPNSARVVALVPPPAAGPVPASPPPAVPPAAPAAQHKQRQRLRGLLVDQFPKRLDLSMLLEDSLGEDLNAVAGEKQDHVEVCHELVKWLWIDLTGRLKLFLAEAVRLRPNSTDLRAFLQEVTAAA